MIVVNESPATRKAWSPEIVESAPGLVLAPLSVLFLADEYAVPALAVACGEPGSYRLALVRSAAGAAMALVDEARGLPDGYEEIVYLARWTLAEGQTCADVEIEVTRRVLVDRPPTVMDVPVYEGQVDEETGEIRQVQVGTEPVIVPPDPLPEPTRHVVSPVLVLPRQPTIAERIEAIEARTVAAIAAGFTFRGKLFSADQVAQNRATAYYGVRELLTYPVEWRALDGSTLDLATAADLTQFYLAGLSFVAAHVNAETAAIKAVRAEAGE